MHWERKIPEKKNANAISAQKKPKKDKQLIENCPRILLLPVCGKILEWLIYNNMFEFFAEN